MFYSRQINHKIIKLLERALRIVYKDHFSSFEELLSKYKSVTVHQRNLQILATEMYKILDGYASIFKTKSNFYTTPNAQGFSSRHTKTVRRGLQTISYMAPKILDLLPKEMKQVTTLNEFKAKNQNLRFRELSLPTL